jgi:regulator of protease activity HflC (stomatin/prohibitin superfamily)
MQLCEDGESRPPAAIAFIAILIAIGTVKKIPKLYHAFIVPEGYAGLLYQHGKFVGLLTARRHVRWGRNFTVDAEDLRKTFLAVAGEEVLTTDNIGVKLSLLVTYQVADPVKLRTKRRTGRTIFTTRRSSRSAVLSVVSPLKYC